MRTRRELRTMMRLRRRLSIKMLRWCNNFDGTTTRFRDHNVAGVMEMLFFMITGSKMLVMRYELHLMLIESMEVIFRDWREREPRSGRIWCSTKKRISRNLFGVEYLRVRVEF